MVLSLSLIPGVMVGFELVTEVEDEIDDDSSTTYLVLDLFIIRLLMEW